MTTLNPTEVQGKGEELLLSGSGKTSWKFYLCWASVDKLEQAKQGKGGLREGNDVRQAGSQESSGQVSSDCAASRMGDFALQTMTD